MAAPKAQAWSELATLMGMFKTSESVCITKGDFFATPPIAITCLMGTPSLMKRSTMALEPNAVASTMALNNLMASVPRLSPEIAALSEWLASGVRRPLTQSSATGSLSVTGSFAASSERYGISFWASSSAAVSPNNVRTGSVMTF